MTDKMHAHNLTAQILAGWCQGGKLAAQYTAPAEGASIGKFLGNAYQELFNLIITAEKEEPVKNAD